MPPAAFLHPQNAPKSLALGLRAPQTYLAGLRGLLLRRGKGGEGKEGE